MLQIIIYDKPNKAQDYIENVEGHRRITFNDKYQIHWQTDIKHHLLLRNKELQYISRRLAAIHLPHCHSPLCLTVYITNINMFYPKYMT